MFHFHLWRLDEGLCEEMLLAYCEASSFSELLPALIQPEWLAWNMQKCWDWEALNLFAKSMYCDHGDSVRAMGAEHHLKTPRIYNLMQTGVMWGGCTTFCANCRARKLTRTAVPPVCRVQGGRWEVARHQGVMKHRVIGVALLRTSRLHMGSRNEWSPQVFGDEDVLKAGCLCLFFSLTCLDPKEF